MIIGQMTRRMGRGGIDMTDYTLHHGDCLEVMRSLSDNSIDLTVTSPPYDNLRDYGKDFNGWGSHIWKPCLDHLFRVTKKGGVVVWVVNDATINGSETGTSFRQALYAKEIGFNLHDTMIWNKMNFTNPTPDLYHAVFEYMFVFGKGTVRLNQIKDRINKRSGEVHTPRNREKDGTVIASPKIKIATHGKRHNVWEVLPCLSSKERLHPAPFPVRLAKDHIISWSNECDTVLDPFCGSGTTGVACMETGRKFIGIELDADYYAIAERRIYDATRQQRLF